MDFEAQLKALWARVDLMKLVTDPEFPATLLALLNLLRRSLKDTP